MPSARVSGLWSCTPTDRGVLERLERITAVRDAGIAAPRKAELILMDMEIVQLVGAVDQLPYLAAMEGRADRDLFPRRDAMCVA